MKDLHIDPFVQFVAYDSDKRPEYIESLFAYLMKAEKSITMYLSSLNTIYFDAIFETEEEMYKELEDYVATKEISYKALVGLQTSKFFKKSAKKSFYRNAKKRNKEFFTCNTFMHFLSSIDRGVLSLFLEGRPFVNNDNIIIIDEKILILERYEYAEDGTMVPQNFLIAGDMNYIQSMTSNFDLKFKNKNKFQAELLGAIWR